MTKSFHSHSCWNIKMLPAPAFACSSFYSSVLFIALVTSERCVCLQMASRTVGTLDETAGLCQPTPPCSYVLLSVSTGLSSLLNLNPIPQQPQHECPRSLLKKACKENEELQRSGIKREKLVLRVSVKCLSFISCSTVHSIVKLSQFGYRCITCIINNSPLVNCITI